MSFPLKFPFVDDFLNFPIKSHPNLHVYAMSPSLVEDEVRRTWALRPRTPKSTKAWKNPIRYSVCNYDYTYG